MTRNRESRPLLDGALGRLPEPLRGRAQRRLVREGNEAWATRVNAIEGLIGLLRADELPTVVRGLSVFHESGSLRSALLAVSSRAAHSNFDPCAPSATEFPPSSLSWSSVRPLNTDCTTRLTADEEDELALALVALPLPMSQSITGALVTALGSIGSPKAQGRFETFRCDDPRLCEWLAGETAKASKSISAARRHGPRVRATQ